MFTLNTNHITYLISVFVCMKLAPLIIKNSKNLTPKRNNINKIMILSIYHPAVAIMSKLGYMKGKSEMK